MDTVLKNQNIINTKGKKGKAKAKAPKQKPRGKGSKSLVAEELGRMGQIVRPKDKESIKSVLRRTGQLG